MSEELSIFSQPAPLADRLRPKTLEEFVGQEQVVEVVAPAARARRLPSLILWGPPGSGKTTLARLLAKETGLPFHPLSAVSAGLPELRRVLARTPALMFLDEIHRWNRAQQDAVLPYVETGALTLIGATTENPSFEVNAALLSRCRVFRLEALTEEQVEAIVRRAGIRVEEAAMAFLVRAAAGDARVALTALELAAKSGEPVTEAAVRDAMQSPHLVHDKGGDQHYAVISAFIKSVRGSDPDAAVYWLARLLEAGEDVRFVARRLVILAAEDVGLADPLALPIAVAAQQAAHFVGLPEASLPLSEATIYLARAKKSNSAYLAYRAAAAAVRERGALPVPLHLRNAVTALDRAMGHGRGYRYAHDFPGHVAEQEHLPRELVGSRFYRPGELGWEASAAGLPAAGQPPGAGAPGSGDAAEGEAGIATGGNAPA